MDGLLVATALLSAFLHAGWNAAVKASPDVKGAMAAQVVSSGLISLPLLLLVPLPPQAAWPWLAVSTLFNILAMVTLLRGYANGGGFGLVYPLSRATSPLLVALFARVAIGETPSTTGLVGIALVSFGVALFASGDGGQRKASLAYALAAGAFSAAYAVSDAQGARLSPSPMGYGLVVSVINAIVFGTLHRLRTGTPIRHALKANVAVATLGSSAAIASYVLILWVWTQAPIALGSALRDTSMIFGALLATFVLGETMTRRRAAAIGCATLGAAVLRFA